MVKAPPQKSERNVAPSQPAIVLVAFGSSDPEARKVYQHIDGVFRQHFHDYDIFWAFTSQRINQKLKKQGIRQKSPEEILVELKHRGYRAAVFQSLHVVPGEEFYGMKQDTLADDLQLRYGQPLLASGRDLEAVSEVLLGEMKPDAVNVLVGHGNRKHREYNDRLVDLALRLEQQRDNVVVATVEGTPGLTPLQQAKELGKKLGAVHFIPLLLVNGIHLGDDVLGDHPESWKSIIGARQTSCAEALGWNEKILAIYLDHLRVALHQLSPTSESSVP
jgi:sirohydrochlorin cobaltochelatase